MKAAKTIFLTILFSTLLLPFFSSTTKANILRQPINEILLPQGERKAQTVTIVNEENKKISVSPKVYPYSAEDESLINGDGYIFVKTDLETFDINPKEEISLRYEIIPPQNLQPGTYFNLIIFEEQDSTSILNQTNPVNTTANLSQLVVLHLTEAGNVLGINSNFANVTLEIADQGVPFIKPTKVKYIYQNITNYVLQPEGEIQIFNIDGKYQPTYIKINKDSTKTYPNNIFEEEIEINNWKLRDIISQRKIIGRFYNGIDENFITKEVITESYSLYLIGVGVFLILIVLVLKSLRDDHKKGKVIKEEKKATK